MQANLDIFPYTNEMKWLTEKNVFVKPVGGTPKISHKRERAPILDAVSL